MSGHPLLNHEAQPPSSSSTSSSNLALPWPFSDPDLIFYLDPYSQEAQDLKNKLQDQATTNSLVFPFTLAINLASHILLDPACEESAPLRSVALPQLVVALAWLEDSIDAGKALPKKDYHLLVPSGQTVDGGEKLAVSYDPRKWEAEEEEELARYLASDPKKQHQTVEPMWKSYAKSHPSRSFKAYREWHRRRKDAFFDPRVAELRAANDGQPIVYEHPLVDGASQKEEDAMRRRILPNRKEPMPTVSVPAPEERESIVQPLRDGNCFNCHVTRARSFVRVKGKGDRKFCNLCYSIAYEANKTGPRRRDEALAARRKNILGDEVAHRATSSDLADASVVNDPQASRERLDLPPAIRYDPRAWTTREENDMARFLASDPRKPGQTMASVWSWYGETHPFRAASSYATHYVKRRRDFFDSMIAELQAKNNGLPVIYEAPKVYGSAREDLIPPRVLPNRNEPTPSIPFPIRMKHGKCSNCNVDRSSLFSRIKGKGDKRFCYMCYRAAYLANKKNAGTEDEALAARRRKVLGGNAEDRSTSPESEDLASKSSTSDASRSPQSIGCRKRPQEAEPGAEKRTRLAFSPARSNAIASSSSSSSFSDPHLLVQPSSQPVASGSRSLSSQPLAPGSPPAQTRPQSALPFRSLEPPPPRPIIQHTASSNPNTTSLTASSSHNHHPHPLSPSPVASGSNSSSNQPPPSLAADHALPPPPSRPQLPLHPRLPSSPPPEPLEPPSFLILGSKPSNCSPFSDACFFCGSATQPPFTLLTLAAKSLKYSNLVVSVPGRVACWVCTRVYQTRVVDGKRLGEGVKEMGELERLAWVTEVLVEKGLRERRRRVEG